MEERGCIMIRLAIIDDDPVESRTFATSLESDPDLRVVSVAADGSEILRRLSEDSLDPDVLLLEIDRFVPDGMFTLQQLKDRAPQVTIIALSAFQKSDSLATALSAGADGFLSKDVSTAELVLHVKNAYSGHSVVSARPASLLLNGYRSLVIQRQGSSELTKCVSALSPTLYEVFSLLIQAQSNKAIAQELSLTDATVRTYVSRILDATACESRTQLAVRAIEAGL